MVGLPSAPSTFWISLPEALSALARARADAGGRLLVVAAGREHEPEAQDGQQGEEGMGASHVVWMLLLGDRKARRRPRGRPRSAILMPAGVTARWSSGERGVGGEGDERDDDARRELARRAVDVRADDRAPERVDVGQRGDRRGRDHRHERDADAGHDRRQRERQLDLEGDLPPGQAVAARRVDRLGVDPADAHVGVGDDRRDRQQHEREADVEEADAEEGDEEHDQAERRDRAADVRGAGGEELVAADVAEPDAERHRDTPWRSASRRATSFRCIQVSSHISARPPTLDRAGLRLALAGR